MIHYSVFGLKKGRKGSLKKQVVISIVYSLAVVAFFGLDICKSEQGCGILPRWVKP
jgi:hypothetical protein